MAQDIEETAATARSLQTTAIETAVRDTVGANATVEGTTVAIVSLAYVCVKRNGKE